MATACIARPTSYTTTTATTSNEDYCDYFNYDLDLNASSSDSCETDCSENSNTVSCSEPPKISKFFSNYSNYQSKIQQLISFSFTSSNFLFITFILSISKLCTTAAAASTDPLQTAGAPPHASSPTTAPNFLMNNFSGSALLEKLIAFKNTSPLLSDKGKHTPAAGNSIHHSAHGRGSNSAAAAASASVLPSSLVKVKQSGSSHNSFFGHKGLQNMDIRFLNVSGKIGTTLGIGK